MADTRCTPVRYYENGVEFAALVFWYEYKQAWSVAYVRIG